MKEIRLGMIGAGQIAYQHCRLTSEHPQATVVAVADPSRKRTKLIQDEFDITRAYTSADELIADKDIDAVMIAVPNVFHAPMSLAAIRAGKHVLLDKPFAMNYKEAKQVADAAKKAKKVFVLGMNQRFQPGAQTIHALAQRKTFGDIYHAKAYWLRRSGIPTLGTWFCDKKMSGGGAMLDIGVHLLDLCLFIIDNFQPVAVSGQTFTKFGNRGLGEGDWGMSDKKGKKFDVDDFAMALIKMKNGATVHLEVSWALHQEQKNEHDIRIFGTKAGASAFPAKVFRYGKKKGEYEVVEPQNVKPVHSAPNRQINWLNVILKKEKPVCTIQQAIAVQKILDAIYKSSETGKEVRIK